MKSSGTGSGSNSSSGIRHSPRSAAHPHLPIQLIAIDLDGTLLTSRKTVSRRTHTALRQAIAAGIHIVLATARPPRSVRSYFNALKLDTPQINYNGALIWDEPARKILHHEPLEPIMARRVIDFGRKAYPELLISIEILDKWYTDHYADVPEYVTETSRHFSPDFVGPLDSFLHVPATKVMLLGHPDWITALEQSVPAKFGARIGQTRSDPHLLQIISPGVNKGAALARVAKRLGVKREHVMAIGDAPNDTDMLKYAGVSVAMDNAWLQVKAHVDHIVPSNDDDGVAVALEKYVLK